MARIVKEFDERFDEFIETAQTLFFNKGYEQTSVQHIINHIGVAKGTFYHYFDSKSDLLEAVVKRNRENLLETVVSPIVNHAEWDALTKFQKLFEQLNGWKLINHSMILDMVRMLYKDENALLCLKMVEETRSRMAGPFAEIIEQGVTEGTFHVNFAYETAEVILRMCEMPSRTLITAILNGVYNDEDVNVMEREVEVFNRSIERVCGIAENTVDLFQDAGLKGWLSLLEQNVVDQVR